MTLVPLRHARAAPCKECGPVHGRAASFPGAADTRAKRGVVNGTAQIVSARDTTAPPFHVSPMSSTGSFYEKKRVGKARALAASPGTDAAGALLRHLDETSASKPDVAALVRDVEEADAALASTGPAHDTDAVVTPALASVPFSTLTDDPASSREMAATHASRGRDTADPVADATSGPPSMQALVPRRGPSLTIPFLVVGAFIIAGLGLPSLRRAAAPVATNQTATAPATAAQAPVTPAGQPVTDPAEQDIRSAVTAYAEAYSRLSVADVQAVFPGADAGALQTSFEGLRAQRIDVIGLQVHVAGPRATVEGAWRTTGEATNGSSFVTQSPVVLTLDQRDGRWVIVNRY